MPRVDPLKTLTFSTSVGDTLSPTTFCTDTEAFRRLQEALRTHIISTTDAVNAMSMAYRALPRLKLR